jgi:hypothetical protein
VGSCQGESGSKGKALPCKWTNPFIDPFVHLVNGCEFPKSPKTWLYCKKKQLCFDITMYNLKHLQQGSVCGPAKENSMKKSQNMLVWLNKMVLA